MLWKFTETYLQWWKKFFSIFLIILNDNIMSMTEAIMFDVFFVLLILIGWSFQGTKSLLHSLSLFSRLVGVNVWLQYIWPKEMPKKNLQFLPSNFKPKHSGRTKMPKQNRPKTEKCQLYNEQVTKKLADLHIQRRRHKSRIIQSNLWLEIQWVRRC